MLSMTNIIQVRWDYLNIIYLEIALSLEDQKKRKKVFEIKIEYYHKLMSLIYIYIYKNSFNN
jgi:hypothetical protein